MWQSCPHPQKHALQFDKRLRACIDEGVQAGSPAVVCRSWPSKSKGGVAGPLSQKHACARSRFCISIRPDSASTVICPLRSSASIKLRARFCKHELIQCRAVPLGSVAAPQDWQQNYCYSRSTARTPSPQLPIQKFSALGMQLLPPLLEIIFSACSILSVRSSTLEWSCCAAKQPENGGEHQHQVQRSTAAALWLAVPVVPAAAC